MHAEVKKVYVESGPTSKWRLLLVVALMLVPDAVLHTAILGLPQGVSAKSSITNLMVIALGASLLTLTVLKYFGRKVLLVLFFVNLAVSVFIAAFYDAFRHVPGYRLAYQNVTEGMAVANVWWIFFPLPFFLLGLACGAAALLAGRGVRLHVPRSWLLLCGVLCAALHLTLAARVDPAVYLVSNTPNAFAHRHGYYVSQVYDLAWSAWQGDTTANAVLLDAERYPVPALGLAGATDTLDGASSVLLVQVESLGWEVLHLAESGKAVTPFLNYLAQRVAVMKLKANHSGSAGSAGSDFQVMTGLRPSKLANVYLDRDFPWAQRLPETAMKNGFDFEMVHGNDSEFLHRATAYRAMGVRHFRDPRSAKLAADTAWGWSDRRLFGEALDSLEAAGDTRSVKLIVTLSSHTPFNFVDNGFMPGADVRSRYLTSINYADHELGRFIERLSGKHLVVLWGDHESGALDAEAASHGASEEYVPGFVFMVNDGKVEKLVVSADARALLSGRFEIASLNSLAGDMLGRLGAAAAADLKRTAVARAEPAERGGR